MKLPSLLRASSFLRHSDFVIRHCRSLAITFGILFTLTTLPALAAVPQLINHQGRIAVNGTNFEGTGLFKFALVNSNGSTSYWSNDGTSTAGSQPSAAVSIPVVKGLYAVLLGDTTLANMTALPASAFTQADVRLRVWFNDGSNGFQLITPDQRLAAAPFALNAASAESVPSGSVTSSMLGSDLTLAGSTTGTFIGSLSGNATTATQFTGALAGDVTGTQSATAISNATVTSKLITGFSSAAGTITTADSLLTAINKLDGNIALRAPLASPTFTGTVSGTFVGNGAGLTNVTASSVQLSSVIAPPVKPVVAWGDNDHGQASVPALVNVANVAAGTSHSLVLLDAGTIVQFGSIAAAPGTAVNVTHIAAGTAHNLARKSDGTVIAWGNNTHGQTTVPGGITTATNVSAGEKHSLILKADGTVQAWGDNSFGQTTIPGMATNVTAIASGYDHNLALKADGTVVAWGRDDAGQVTGTYPTVGVIVEIIDSTKYRLSTNLANGTSNLRYDGTTLLNSTGDGSDIVTVASTVGLSSGMTVTRASLVGPSGLSNVVAIACGAFHSLALKSDGTVVAWGWDTGGQVTGAENLTGISRVAGGYAFTLALKNDGTLVAFGDNTDGQLTIPNTATQVTHIACGASHALALRADLIPAQVARLDQDNVFTGRVGIQRTPAANNLEVQGNASKTTAGNWLANSDRRIKDDIQPITGAIEKLGKVHLVDFQYSEAYRQAHPEVGDKRYLNVIAQEFAEIFPEHVQNSGEKLPDGSPILQVDTYPLTIYSAAAVQELAKENEALKKKLAEQEERLKKLEALIK